MLYVDCNAKHNGNGSKEYPYSSIGEAAKVAKGGDKVLVKDGIYREYVDPIFSGEMDNRIEYISENKGGAVISGAEIIDNWEKSYDSVWVARIDNELFGDYNPYTTKVIGDWLESDVYAHTGEVYLNGKSLYEVSTLEAVRKPRASMKAWYPEESLLCWYCEQDDMSKMTYIYANFGEKNPNEEIVEINVRRNCFMPSKKGISYITLSGFKITMAATQWAPPTAFQDGMIGPNWAKGWIIEDCEISNSKCSGISLGKYYQSENDNKWSKEKIKDGTQTQRECVCIAAREGWSKDKIGSHIIRKCIIHDCGQTGIVGHMGAVFSVIENNHIYNINIKRNIAGAEIAGIKLHAAIDVVIKNNYIHHCSRGLWLDWQAQGTRVSSNVFHDNTLPFDHLITPEITQAGEDIFIEVSHGPTLVDNNVLLSDYALKLPTQGVAIVNNLIAGSLTTVGKGVDNGSLTIPSPRFTPYHVPHQTDIQGFMTILHGDMWFYNNIFVQKEKRDGLLELEKLNVNNEWDDFYCTVGTKPYEDYPSYEEYMKNFEGYCGMGADSSDRYYSKLPVRLKGNAYFNGAAPSAKEEDALVYGTEKVYVFVKHDEKGVFLETNVYDFASTDNCVSVDTKYLGIAFEPEQAFENPDGSELYIDTDINGNRGKNELYIGPIKAGSMTEKYKLYFNEIIC